jgi:PAS domain S-box-containing protein
MIGRAPTGAHTWLLNLPPTRRQTRWVIAIASCQIAAFALVAPFAQTPLAQVNGFLTAFAGIIFVTNLVTSVLLFSQFAIQRDRALLVLACGYFLSALLIIPNVLTFPGAFSPTGLLGAGLQTSLWLYWFWHLSFALALLGYGLMRSKKSEPGPVQASPLAVIVQSIALLLALAGGLTLLATAGQDYLPVVYADRISRGPVPSRLRGVWPIMMLVSVSGLAVLWFRRRSLLDQWLMIIALAAILENGLIPFYTMRYSLGFYAIRLFTLLTSTIVLVVLLAETMRLYGNLQESERRLRSVIDGIPGFVGILASNGDVEALNRQILEYSGQSLEELKNWTTNGTFHHEDLPQLVEVMTKAIASGVHYRYEARLRRRDGEYRWFDVRGVPVRESSGRIARWYALLTDIEDRRRSEARYQNLFQAMSVAFFELDYSSSRQILRALRDEGVQDFRGHFKENPHLIREIMCTTFVVDVNDRTVALFGRGNKEELLTSVGAFWPEESLGDYVEAVLATIAGNDKFSTETRVRRLDGTIFDAQFTLRYVTEDKTRGLAGVIDITERKRAEVALGESEAKFRAAIDGIAGFVAIMAPNGKLESVNRQIIEYFGRSLEELKDWGTGDAVHPEDLPRVLESFERSLATGTPFHHEVRMRRFDGEYRWFENRGAPIRNESGDVTRWYCLLTDIEDRTQALARLQKMQSDFAHINRVNTMGELAASLSHEILHPIATARNNARAGMRFLEMSPPNFDEVKEALGCVVRDVDRAKDIVGRVRNQIKKAPPRREQFDLNEAVRETLVMVRSAIARNKIAITADLKDELIRVQGDRVQLQQVIVNLILNAVEAISSEENGARELSIRIEQHRAGDGGVLVQVRDSGPGIDRGNVDRVFEPFYTTKSTGVGMGLSICRSIINDHGGRLWAEANEPRGAVFQFTLPHAQEGL